MTMTSGTLSSLEVPPALTWNPLLILDIDIELTFNLGILKFNG